MGVLTGIQTPRIWTPPAPDLPTLGPQIGALTEVTGAPPFEWQATTVGVMLQFDPTTGRWVRRGVVVVIARQNGKTWVLKARILGGLFLIPGDRLILHTAQDRAVPRNLFEEMVTTIEANPTLSKRIAKRGIREANGQERITLKDGSTYRILAPQAARFRTWSADVLIFDEAREQRDETLWGAAIPTQRARPNPQWIMASNAGDPDSVVLNRQAERGRQSAIAQADEGKIGEVGYLEWSADPELDIDDRQGWRQANPSLGRLIGEADIESEREALTEEAFRTEILCQWVDTAGRSAVPFDGWLACGEPQPIPTIDPEDRTAKTWFAIDVDPEHTLAVLVAARWIGDRLVVGVVDRWEDPEGIDELQIAKDVREWRGLYRPKSLAYDPWTAAGITENMKRSRTPMVPVTGVKFVTACREFHDAVVNGRLWHNNDPDLTAQVRAAVRRDASDGTWAIARAYSAIPIPGVLAMARAVGQAYNPTKVRR